MRTKVKFILLFLWCFFIQIHHIYAQEIFYGNVEAGRVIEEQKENLVPPLKQDFFDSKKPNLLEIPTGAESVKFFLRKIEIAGITAYESDEIKDLYEDKINQNVTLKDIYEIANSVSRKYHKDGFTLSRAYLVPQTIENGLIKISVVEVGVSDTHILGIENLPQSIKNIISRTESSFPFNVKTLEKNILLINDVPGISATAVISVSNIKTSLNQENVEISFVFYDENSPVQIKFNNYGTKFSGPFQIEANVSTHDIIPFHNVSFSGVAATQVKELQYIQIRDFFIINSYGSSLELSGSLARTEPGSILEDLEYESRAEQYSAALTHPLIRSRKDNLYLKGTFTYKNNKTDVLGSKLYLDRESILTLETSYDFPDKLFGSNLVQFQLDKGLDIFNSSENNSPFLSVAEGETDFTSVAFNYGRLQYLNQKLYAYFSTHGQYAFNQLLSSDQFSYGGLEYGRAYNPSEIRGDHGISAKMELHLNVEDGINNTTSEIRGVYDIGKAWSKDGSIDDESGSSIGIGYKITFNENLTADLLIAQPLTREINNPAYGNGKNPRYLFSINATF